MAWLFKNRKLVKNPKFCRYCLNHSVVVLFKGHKSDCNYKTCQCVNCKKTADKIDALKLRRRNRRNDRQTTKSNPNVAALNMTHHAAGVHGSDTNIVSNLERYIPTRALYEISETASTYYNLENFYDGMYLSRNMYPVSDDLEIMLKFDDDFLSLFIYLTLNRDDTFSENEVDA